SLAKQEAANVPRDDGAACRSDDSDANLRCSFRTLRHGFHGGPISHDSCLQLHPWISARGGGSRWWQSLRPRDGPATTLCSATRR
ncbi:unnamed protein product, partial [Urochloa humidicola]